MNKESNSYKYENEIPFAIDEVKTAIRDIVTKNRTRFLHDEKDLNDMFNTYRFGEVKCSYMVSLKKVDDNTTHIAITCSERYGGLEKSMASLEGYVNEFLTILSTKLSGANDEEVQATVKANNSDAGLENFGCIVTIIGAVISLFILMSAFM